MTMSEMVLNLGVIALLAAGSVMLVKVVWQTWRKAASQDSIDQGLAVWAWWVEVSTATPRCTYYFGPFDSQSEAQTSQPDYVQDLEQEGAMEIQAQVKWCKPRELTVCDSLGSELPVPMAG